MPTVLTWTSTTTDAPVRFEHIGRAEGLFTRCLTVRGERAYELSFSCDTCAFLFARLGGFDPSAWDLPELQESFRCGVTDIDPELLKKIAPIIPAGEYTVMMTEITPRRVVPCADDDYFSHEQVALWGVDPVSGLPQYPRTEYYRGPVTPTGDDAALFEFIAPMMPKHWLDADTIETYRRHLLAGHMPTALAITILDVKQPATWDNNPPFTRHDCLVHFLLDGHHKVFAASLLNMPISLLSFIAREECVASPAEIGRAITLLTTRDGKSLPG